MTSMRFEVDKGSPKTGTETYLNSMVFTYGSKPKLVTGRLIVPSIRLKIRFANAIPLHTGL
jgi:hypothetical protein